MVRRFVHSVGFRDNTAYIEISDTRNWLVRRDGSRRRWLSSPKAALDQALAQVQRGQWMEVPVGEFGDGPGAKKLEGELDALKEQFKVSDKRRIHMENYGGDAKLPQWFPKPKEKGKPIPVDEIDRVIQEQTVADTEIQVQDYVHQPNKVIPPGTARVVLFKDGRVALLTAHVGFFLAPEDVDFIANLSQGQRGEGSNGLE